MHYHLYAKTVAMKMLNSDVRIKQLLNVHIHGMHTVKVHVYNSHNKTDTVINVQFSIHAVIMKPS